MFPVDALFPGDIVAGELGLGKPLGEKGHLLQRFRLNGRYQEKPNQKEREQNAGNPACLDSMQTGFNRNAVQRLPFTDKNFPQLVLLRMTKPDFFQDHHV